MDWKRNSSNSSSSSEGGFPSSATKVLAIECVTAESSKNEEWNRNKLRSGDIVEEIQIGESSAVKAPFKRGKSGVNKLLHGSFKKGETSIIVRVRRGRMSGIGDDRHRFLQDYIELASCIVPHNLQASSSGKKQYVLRSINDPTYAVGFVDRTENECFQMQGSKSSRVATALSKAQLQDGYVAYPWERKMKDSLPILQSSCFLSLLILPRSTEAAGFLYNTMEDTLARANSWLNSSQSSGVPIVFMNIQTESLLTKISGDAATSAVSAGSLSDLSNLANASLYGFEDYHGVDIGVVKAVRIWYTPVAGEYAIEIKLMEGDTKLGFAISRTEEGFLYISSVVDDDDPGLPSTRSGLRDLYKEAGRVGKLIVISRVSNEKVLPWMVSSAGAIRCYDTVSLSQKLSLHRHAMQSILIHVLMWDRQNPPPPPHISSSYQTPESSGGGAQSGPQPIMLPPTPDQMMQNLSLNDEGRMVRDGSGEASFRFIDFPI